MHAKDHKIQVSSMRIPNNDVRTPVMSRRPFTLGTHNEYKPSMRIAPQ